MHVPHVWVGGRGLRLWVGGVPQNHCSNRLAPPQPWCVAEHTMAAAGLAGMTAQRFHGVSSSLPLLHPQLHHTAIAACCRPACFCYCSLPTRLPITPFGCSPGQQCLSSP